MTQGPAARPWLAPLVPLYRLGLALRELGLRTGLEPVRRLRWPVIGIGNLSTGGAGKTPLTIALAQALIRRGLHVDVLSRGYGRGSRIPARVDPDGTAEEFGDEPLLIARATGVPVYVAAERYQAGLLAERDAEEFLKTKDTGFSPYLDPTQSTRALAPEATASEEQEVSGHDSSRATNARQSPRALAAEDEFFGVHLLDDGFQHRRLHRDVNILLLDGGEWSSGRLLPAGNLREPLRALHRADVLAIPAAEATTFEQSLRSRGQWQGPIWRLHRQMDVPQIDGRVIAFCGIARPEQFFAGCESAGMHLAARVAFPDHHRYTLADLERLRDTARSASAQAFVTTEKDRVRLGSLAASFPKSSPLKTARLHTEIENEHASFEWLMDRLAPRLSQPSQ